MIDWDRPLDDRERARVAAARQKVRILYDGRLTGHRSCGIAMAEGFGLPSRAYQSLRRGGLTGRGPCGVALGGRLVLGDLLGDPDPSGPPTALLRAAIDGYDLLLARHFQQPVGPDPSCGALVDRFPDFKGAERHAHCTVLAADVAAIVAEVLVRAGWDGVITPIDGVSDIDPSTP